jgi:SAM-dependent methyltransferase
MQLAYAGIGGYSCLLHELVPALRGQKRYGRDFERNGELLAIGSHFAGRHVYPFVVAEMQQLNVRTVADLGCGTANVLLSLCDLDPKLKGVGIDISAGAIEEAGHRVQARGMADRIQLVVADLRKPEEYAKNLSQIEAFNAIMVFHEFLRDGEQAVIEMFQRMKQAFPGRYFFMGEFDSMSDEEYKTLPYPDRIPLLFYQYITHPLSLQGLPMAKARWLDLFKRAGIEVVKVKDGMAFRLNIYVLRF